MSLYLRLLLAYLEVLHKSRKHLSLPAYPSSLQYIRNPAINPPLSRSTLHAFLPSCSHFLPLQHKNGSWFLGWGRLSKYFWELYVSINLTNVHTHTHPLKFAFNARFLWPFTLFRASLICGLFFLFSFPFLSWPCASGPYFSYHTFFGGIYDTLCQGVCTSKCQDAMLGGGGVNQSLNIFFLNNIFSPESLQ